ncbi:hypothetical protein EVAR_20880_1 [Eumeta japonica]|uniref:Secreted protein n=1 Tax=Eumeta variegata TaxID=151549 RepID=A0A4C1UVW9_EUMVA|nr:hypothetical protein EVAR_20880_1 [Eumeta japonica]
MLLQFSLVSLYVWFLHVSAGRAWCVARARRKSSGKYGVCELHSLSRVECAPPAPPAQPKVGCEQCPCAGGFSLEKRSWSRIVNCGVSAIPARPARALGRPRLGAADCCAVYGNCTSCDCYRPRLDQVRVSVACPPGAGPLRAFALSLHHDEEKIALFYLTSKRNCLSPQVFTRMGLDEI